MMTRTNSFNFLDWYQQWFGKNFKPILIIFSLVSIGLSNYVNYIKYPVNQFKYTFYSGHPHVQIVHSPDNIWAFDFYKNQLSRVTTYFIYDAVWATLFVLFMLGIFLSFYRKIAQNKTNDGIESQPKSKKTRTGIILSFVIILVALGSDFLEGILNIMWYNSANHDLKDSIHATYLIKIIAYSIFILLITLPKVFQFLMFKWENSESIKPFVKNYLKRNVASIVVLVALVALITQMDQGGILLDTMMRRTLNLISFITLLIILSYMTWQWPYYHNLAKAVINNGTNNHYIKTIKLIPFIKRFFAPMSQVDAITEDPIDRPIDTFIRISFREKSFPNEDKLSLKFQRLQGSFIFLLPSLVLGIHFMNTVQLRIASWLIIVLLMVQFILWFYSYNYFYELRSQLNKIKSIYTGLLISIFVLAIILFIIPEDFIYIKVLLFFLLMTGLTLFHNNHAIHRLKIKKTGMGKTWLRWITQDIYIMFWLSASFLIATFFLVFAQSAKWYTSHIEPINIILLVIVFYFGVANILIKAGNLIRIYNTSNDEKHLYQRYLRIIATAFCLIVVLLFVTTNIFDNDFHQLPVVENKESGISIKEFLKEKFDINEGVFTDSTIAKKDTVSMYMIAADGGGLRGAFWNLLVMNALQKHDPDFYSQVAAVSGVSGGMIGQGLYFTLAHLDSSQQSRIINEIGTKNFLSHDILHLMWVGLGINLVPFKINNWCDASERMMGDYQRIINKFDSTSINSNGFVDYWRSRFDPNPQNYPLVIVNSTRSESVIKGVASPLLESKEIFAPHVSMLDISDTTSIPYIDAVFTANRFPFFSPTAGIKGKGHFLDGGYFENSGLSSILELIDELENYTWDKHLKITIVNIGNDKSGFIRSQFSEYKDSVTTNFIRGEIGPVISAAAGGSTTGQPIYYSAIAEKFKQQKKIHDFVTIEVPYLLSVEQIEKEYGGKIHIKAIRAAVDQMNKSIYNLYDFKPHSYVVNPPLGRTLSMPVFDYMTQMIQHKSVVQVFDRIYEQ